MALIIEDTLTELVILLTAFLVLVTNYFYTSYKYWEKRGVPTIPPRFPLGNTNTLLPKSFAVGTLSKSFYDRLKQQGHKFGGVYLVTQPNLILVDPQLIKTVLTNDFQYFVDRGFYYNVDDPITAHLFAVDGIQWRNLRVKLTPTFTSGKMKSMFNTVVTCSEHMKDALGDLVGQDINIKEIMGRFTTDVIGTCAFGITCNSFKYPDAEFRTMGKKSSRLKIYTDEIRSFFMKIVTDTVKMRKENHVKRNDFLQILIDLETTMNFTVNEMAAQTLLFSVAGFETSATTMTFALYELARHPHTQDKLREEIRQVLDKYEGQLDYESLKDMKYLQQVLNETLRMYPPVPNLNRKCVKDYVIPGTDITIEKDTPLLISALGIQRDQEFFPDPDTFDPERFSEERRKEFPEYAYLPFGDGPRNCIGLRFGVMQSKIGILAVVKRFKLSVSPFTKPVQFHPYKFLLNTIDDIYVRSEKIE